MYIKCICIYQKHYYPSNMCVTYVYKNSLVTGSEVASDVKLNVKTVSLSLSLSVYLSLFPSLSVSLSPSTHLFHSVSLSLLIFLFSRLDWHPYQAFEILKRMRQNYQRIVKKSFLGTDSIVWAMIDFIKFPLSKQLKLENSVCFFS